MILGFHDSPIMESGKRHCLKAMAQHEKDLLRISAKYNVQCIVLGSNLQKIFLVFELINELTHDTLLRTCFALSFENELWTASIPRPFRRCAAAPSGARGVGASRGAGAGAARTF